MTEIKEPPADLRTLADRLRWARKELREMSQPALAKAAGVSSGMIGMLEIGARHNPGSQRLHGIATALDVSARWLATGKGEWKRTPDHVLLIDEVELLLNWRQLPPHDRQAFARQLQNLVNSYNHLGQARSFLQTEDVGNSPLPKVSSTVEPTASGAPQQGQNSGGPQPTPSPLDQATALPGEDDRGSSETNRPPANRTNRGRS